MLGRGEAGPVALRRPVRNEWGGEFAGELLGDAPVDAISGAHRLAARMAAKRSRILRSCSSCADVSRAPEEKLCLS